MAFIILIATAAISLYAMYRNQSIYYRWMFSPWRVRREGAWYTFITSGFLHADLTHLAFNMITFYFFAFRFEEIVGATNFLIIYFGSMIIADLGSFFKHANNPNFRSLGASGAVSGIVFGSILYFPTSKMIIFPLPIPIPAYIFGVLYLAWCFYAERQARDNINHSAHLFGAIAGIVLTVLLEPNVVQHFLNHF
ncbi:MAG: rhomboid family intramembrane serine protease [Ignavibacteria bacterium]|nr:rhomboid family intramembrane serine protease [Ignavibacteria bacterium]